MEGLAGDLGTMPVPDLIQYLANRSLTGTLVCEHGTAKKSISIRDGEAVNAASNDPREYLGQFLINFGHIAEDQLTKAFQTQAETKIFIGRILTMIGAVTEETLKQVLTIKIRETTLGLCRWKEGNFRFARGVLPPDQEGVPVAVPLLDIHREAEFRQTVWDAVLQVFDSPQMGLELDEGKVPAAAPGSFDAQLFELIREGQTIEEILLRMHASDFHLFQRLYALYRQGVVKPVEPLPSVEATIPSASGGATLGEEVAAEQVLGAAREFLSARQYGEAVALAARAVELKLPEAVPVLKDAETGLLEILRRELLGRPLVPRLAPNVRLKELALSPQERYLLSRVDGTRDLKAIVRVSPVREVDALRFFRKFLDEGLLVMP